MIKCPKCGKAISEFSVICPYCNNKIDNKIENISDESVNTKEYGGEFSLKNTKQAYIIISALLLVYILTLLICCVSYGSDYFTNITDIIGTVLLAVSFIAVSFAKENKSTKNNTLDIIFAVLFGILFIANIMVIIDEIKDYWFSIGRWLDVIIVAGDICVGIMFLLMIINSLLTINSTKLLKINSLQTIKSIENFKALKRISILMCVIFYIARLIFYIVNDYMRYSDGYIIIITGCVGILRLAALFIYCYSTKFSKDNIDNISDGSVSIKEYRGGFRFKSTKRAYNAILVLVLLCNLILLFDLIYELELYGFDYFETYNIFAAIGIFIISGIFIGGEVIGTVLLTVSFIKENNENNVLSRIFTVSFGILFIVSIVKVIGYMFSIYVVKYICVSIMFLLLTINSLRTIKNIESFKVLKRINLLSVLICTIIYIAELIIYITEHEIGYIIITENIAHLLRLAALLIFCYNTKFSLDNEEEKGNEEDLTENIL